ncbi:AAA family ATPase [Lusitaniella coriacea LEGE 07157]|uniref:AAA family ATPase n=1 Tax=Lusitaniella coriacea LEGE 07157 TaxID=945747 RepID=A0A8J7IU71_9CYAN|nr:NB-ARC domain-containing protein [Lusitaniella coriacea]MBE9116323.1 AAA family ATPase [Lusitaniella coriacea LEGE 07157]
MSKRQRGVIPTPEALRKLQGAIRQKEQDEERRYTQEKISFNTGLARRTIRKVLNREGAVTLKTLTALFEVFNLELQTSDYTRPETDEAFPEPPEAGSVRRVDWGEAKEITGFCGRQGELKQLWDWTARDRTRVVTLLGMGGTGKTALAVKLVQQLQGEFDFIHWRSLRNALPLERQIEQWVAFISDGKEKKGELYSLLDYLRTSRCLLVLDDVEALLQGGERVGQYRQGYEAYGELLRMMGETAHQSCLLLISREKPTEVAVAEGGRVQSLILGGCAEAAEAILNTEGLLGSVRQKRRLRDRYGNIPLILQIVATAIRDLFEGEIGEFLAQDTLVFSSIRQLLDGQFSRLCAKEQTLVYWLAINQEPTTVAQLKADCIPSLTNAEILENLESLQRRCAIEKSNSQFTLGSIAMAYALDSLLECAIAELTQPNIVDCGTQFQYLRTHALLKAESTEPVRAAQVRLLLNPLARKLIESFGTRDRVREHLLTILAVLQERSPTKLCYLAGNTIDLLVCLGVPLNGCDFSRLTICQADLREVELNRVDFTQSNLARSVFSQVFDSIYAVAFSPDGRLLATGHGDGEVRWWQVASGQLLFGIKGHRSSVWTIAFSPDGRTLASGGYDRTVKLWDIQTGRVRQTLVGYQDWIRAIAFSPDGSRLASCGKRGEIVLYDSVSGAERQVLQGHTAPPTAIAFHPQGTLLASGSEDRTIRLWNARSGECQHILSDRADSISAIAFSSDGTLLASCDSKGIELWNPQTGDRLQRWEDGLTLILAISFSPDSRYLGVSDGCVLKLLDIETGIFTKTLGSSARQIWSVAFSPNGNHLSAGGDPILQLWDVEDEEPLRTWQGATDATQSYRTLDFSPDGQLLASGGDDGSVKLWCVATGVCCETLYKHHKSVRTLAFSPNGRTLATGGDDRALWLWEIQTGTGRPLHPEHQDKVCAIAFSPDSQHLASGSADGTIQLWDLRTDAPQRQFLEHAGAILSLAFSPDNRTLASGSEDRTLKLWDVLTGECLRTLKDHKGWVWSVAFSPDGRTLASGSEDRTLKLWDVLTGRVKATLSGHQQLIGTLAFSPEGTTLVSGSADGTLKYWSLETAQCLQNLRGSDSLIWAFVFLSAQNLLACSSDRARIDLWDVLEGKQLRTFQREKYYAGMKITGVRGLTAAAIANLKVLGAVE